MAEDIRTIALGPLDHIASSNIPQSIIYLSLKEGILPQDAFNCLRAGLHRTLVQTPWLAGRVHYQSQGTPGWRPGQLEVRYPSNAIPLSNQASAGILRFNELDTPLTFADLREIGFPLDSFDDQMLLWTSPFKPDYEAGANVLAAQANFIPGGCLLVLSVAASVSDGTAMLTVTKIWADHCSTAFGQPNDLAVVRPRFTTDRVLLDKLLQEMKKRQSDGHSKDGGSEIAQLVGLDHAQEATLSGFNLGLMEPRIFYMPQSAYTALRKECTKEFGVAEISGNDLICALIFRSLIRASTSLNVRESNGTAPKVASLSLPFDGRPKLLQSMDTLYLGNMNFENRLTIPVEILIASTTSISWVAKAINAHAESSAHPSALLAAYDLARSVREYDSHNGLHAARMSPASASVGVMSPMTLPFNDTCFGKQVFGNNGNPEGFRPLMGSCNRGYRTCFVIPRKKTGGIEFVMTLYREEMDFLSADDEFSRYAFSLS